jgi:hypothetical protein
MLTAHSYSNYKHSGIGEAVLTLPPVKCPPKHMICDCKQEGPLDAPRVVKTQVTSKHGAALQYTAGAPQTDSDIVNTTDSPTRFAVGGRYRHDNKARTPAR